MSKVLIFGHKNPDTDTICSAIAYAELKNKLGLDAEPVRLGEVNGETQYALDQFNAEVPRLVETVANETDSVILVDHNERQQSVNDLDQVRVLEVIDHHRIANFETSDPLYYRAEPVGCTATILNKLYKENGVEIKKETAGLMLSAIISDSLLFKSPTCTEEDVKAAKELAEIAGVDAESYGLEMLKAGADLSAKTIPQLLSLDAKEFTMGIHKVEIAQVNTVDTNDVLSRKEEVDAALSKVVAEKGLDLFVFVVTDILTNDSVVVASGQAAQAVEKAFNVELTDDTATLKGVVSRKKQIVPPLTDALK
ncbi:manganese-dependent inorganic pyrophosphatase [Bacillus swezeyi]|uniref:Probable manganese-dependent inorganic pyrophosphatase n=1 Tax=Bacillus swezeyi TaxID=1925020 RepID=A0A5M8RQR5_9BACI|nr:manganese-dependent inorganic pyrophosphatase [Bacillus swezeyi]KAA6450917.1 manganese-dependent inorganic pyrophosphatase [Bacillus swezeyi]KAA6474884.1 manganese-dependent inorganic pyrophosphatase [Bacillus swezeyi]TYS37451.1 manganese-dependent inorganic pyrophosphatase [Bacillus swezeyi]